MSGQPTGSYTVYVTLLDSTGDMLNPPIVDHVSFTYQSGSGSTQSPGDGTQPPSSGGSGYNDINITYPNVGTLYSNDGNGLTIEWDYQSQSDDIQSLSWSYKLDEDYSTGGNGTEVYGHDSVDGSTWLSGVSYGSHTLYVALLDQTDSNNVLVSDSHSFTYQSGSGSTQSPGGGSGGGSGDTISIQKPSSGDNVNSGNDDLEISYTYSSANGGSQIPQSGHTNYMIPLTEPHFLVIRAIMEAHK